MVSLSISFQVHAITNQGGCLFEKPFLQTDELIFYFVYIVQEEPMKHTLKIVVGGLGMLVLQSIFMPSLVFAQDGDALFGVGFCGIGIVVLALNIALLYWVYKDAEKRGASAGGWLIVVFLFGLLGLLVYLIARPKGKLVPCPECGKQKPITDAICPHCGKRVA